MELAWQSSDLLRWQDKRELEGQGHPPFYALPMSVALTKNPICFYTPDDDLAGFAGVVDEGNGIGRVWMLTTEAVETIPLLFFKEAKISPQRGGIEKTIKKEGRPILGQKKVAQPR